MSGKQFGGDSNFMLQRKLNTKPYQNKVTNNHKFFHKNTRPRKAELSHDLNLNLKINVYVLLLKLALKILPLTSSSVSSELAPDSLTTSNSDLFSSHNTTLYK